MKMHAKTVEDAWRVARREAKAYQRAATNARTLGERHACLAARNAADRIALKIRFGRSQPK